MKNKTVAGRIAGTAKCVGVAGLVGCMLMGAGLQVNAEGVKDIFDAEYYESKNADVKAAFKDLKGAEKEKALYDHFMTKGASEGRLASRVFDVVQYKKNYADLRATFGNDWDAYVNHYFTYGIKEGRTDSTAETLSNANKKTVGYNADRILFDAEAYANRYPDLKKAYGTDYAKLLNHYMTAGMAEGRDASPEDVSKFEATHNVAVREVSLSTDNSLAINSTVNTAYLAQQAASWIGGTYNKVVVDDVILAVNSYDRVIGITFLDKDGNNIYNWDYEYDKDQFDAQVQGWSWEPNGSKDDQKDLMKDGNWSF